MATTRSAPSLYEALSHAPVREAGNKPDLTIYRGPGKPRYGKFEYTAPGGADHRRE